jgi:predicted AlkP superfamily phosphohydrolase/phosphomutase
VSKVLVIGIDSVDSVLLSRFESELPTFRRVKRLSPAIQMKGVQPPDSPVSWSSIFTGVNPARHGVLEYADPLEKTTMRVSKEIENTTIRGKTFWDIAGRFGKRVCVLLPTPGFPVWPVNGTMVGRASVSDEVQAYPSSVNESYELSKLTNLKGVVGRAPESFIERGKQLIQHEMEFTLEMLKTQEWDLLFTYSSVLDPIQHGFWNHFDEHDPTHDSSSPHKGVIKEFYKLYDSVVERYLEAVDSDTTVVLLSDHGHCMRPVQLLNINEVIRREGLLALRDGATSPTTRLMERSKRLLLDFVVRFGLGNLALSVMRAFPGSKRVYTSPLHIDWDRTVAYLSDLSGIKAYSYGGIKIEQGKIESPLAYEEVRDLLIRRLSEMCDPNTGEEYVKWICRREDLYSGEYILRYPDLVFRLQDKYGAGWSVGDSLYGRSHSHSIQPGSHNDETPVFFLLNLQGRDCAGQDMTLMDVAPTLLDLLGIDGEFDFEGSSIVR